VGKWAGIDDFGGEFAVDIVEMGGRNEVRVSNYRLLRMSKVLPMLNSMHHMQCYE
jgi:hypothetical protein